MKIKAYTLTNCSSCKHLKELFKRANVDYTEIVVRDDITVEDFKLNYPNVSQFPYVVIDDQPVGGLVDVVKLFVQKGLVSSKK
jgi:glutaredoxin 3